MTARGGHGARGLGAALAALLVLAGCAGGSHSRAAERGGDDESSTLTVLAAASLTDAFTELAHRFEQRTGAEVRTGFAGSSTLAAQILQGAPAGVYTPANREQMRRVERGGLITHGPSVFAENREVIVVPDENPARILSLRDLARPGVRLVLPAQEVPAAEYAERIINDAGARYGQGFPDRVLRNVRSRDEDVRAAVNRVVVGDADATFGYASDVTPDIRDRVEVIEIPPAFDIAARYPIAVLDQAEDRELARQWVKFVHSDTGQRVLRKWGLQPVRSP